MLEIIDGQTILNHGKISLMWDSESSDKYPKKKLKNLSYQVADKDIFKKRIIETLDKEIEIGIQNTKDPNNHNTTNNSNQLKWKNYCQRISLNVIITDGSNLQSSLISIGSNEFKKYEKYYDPCQYCKSAFNTLTISSNETFLKDSHITTICKTCNGELRIPKSQEKLLEEAINEKEEDVNELNSS